MTTERERVEQLEKDIKALSGQVTSVDKAVAVLDSKVDGIVEDQKDAKKERQAIQVEMKTMGNEVLKLGNTLKDQGRTLDKVEPAVQSLQTDRTMIVGASKAASAAAGPAKAFLWAIIAGLVAIGTFVAGLLSTVKHPPNP